MTRTASQTAESLPFPFPSSMKPLLVSAALLVLVGCAPPPDLAPARQARPVPQGPILAFAEADVPPAPVGGWGYVRMEFPEMARRASVEGVVRTRFVVGPDGFASRVQCVETPNEMLCDAAINAIEEALWTAGREAGEEVAVEAEACHRFEILYDEPRTSTGWCGD